MVVGIATLALVSQPPRPILACRNLTMEQRLVAVVRLDEILALVRTEKLPVSYDKAVSANLTPWP
jgi:hypothetical protein